jgi:hypothetical protein
MIVWSAIFLWVASLMATIKEALGTDAQGITITLASLASGAARESSVIDNVTNLFLDALVEVKVTTNASAPTGDKAVYVYAYASADYTATATYPDAVAGAGDAAVTMNNPTQLKLLGIIFCSSASTTYRMEPASVAQLFGGILPAKWGIVVLNSTGNALDATAGNHEAQYQGIYATST